MNEITQVLERIRKGEPSAAEALLPLVYDELRKLAESRSRPAPTSGPDLRDIVFAGAAHNGQGTDSNWSDGFVFAP